MSKSSIPPSARPGPGPWGLSVASLLPESSPVLASPSAPVTTFGADLAALATEMHAVMLLLRGVGLAAPQIGVPLRVFVFEIPGERGAVVNPVLLERHDPYHPEEGCLSVPGRFFAPLRHREVEASWQELDGSYRTRVLTGLLAEIFEHEVDHLDGVLLHQRPQGPISSPGA